MTSLMCLSGEAMTQLCCLAVAVFFEARGEPTTGQYAVAEVIMNRVEDDRYPDTVCGVVFEDSQFSFTEHYSILSRASNSSKAAVLAYAAQKAKTVASDVLDGYRIGITSTHYHTTSVDPFWTEHFELDGMIGNHLFYTNTTQYR